MGAVVAGLGAVKERVADTIFKVKLFQQVGEFRVGDFGGAVAVGDAAQRLHAYPHGGGGQRRDKQSRHALENIKGRFGQRSHGAGVGQIQPLIPCEKFGVGLDEVVLIGIEAAVIVPSGFIAFPSLRPGALIHSAFLLVTAFFRAVMLPSLTWAGIRPVAYVAGISSCNLRP